MSRTSDTLATVRQNRPYLWLGAVLFFVGGDIATTSVGLSLGPIVELGPVVKPLISRHGLVAMVALKGAVVGACYCLYCCVPNRHNTGIPLGLAAVGVLVTGWNLALIATVVL